MQKATKEGSKAGEVPGLSVGNGEGNQQQNFNKSISVFNSKCFRSAKMWQSTSVNPTYPLQAVNWLSEPSTSMHQVRHAHPRQHKEGHARYISNYLKFTSYKNVKHIKTFQKVHREIPFSSSKEVCTQSELWTYTHTTYPWTPVITTPLFVVRTGLEGPCDDLVADELTEEDLEVCEVVCQPAVVKECAKVLNGTDEDGNEIWEDDQLDGSPWTIRLSPEASFL